MSCIDGYVMLGAKCTKCNPSILNVVGAIAGLMAFLFVLFALLFMKAKKDTDEDENDGGTTTTKSKKGCCGGKKKHRARRRTKRERIEDKRGNSAAQVCILIVCRRV